MNPSRHLNVWLGDDLVGTLAHDAGEHTVFEFNEAYMDMGTSRPILSLAWAVPGDEALSRKLMADPRHRSASIKAPPFFSNLLPEGGLRRRIAHQLAIHPDREFFLLKALGHDLPGAVTLVPADAAADKPHAPSPPTAQRSTSPDTGAPATHATSPTGETRAPPSSPLKTAPSAIHAAPGTPEAGSNAPPPTERPPGTDAEGSFRFSLAGIQLKFSMLRQGERFTLGTGGQLGNYIIKPPTADFPGLPQVEAAAMATARAAGINVPEVLLLQPEQINGLPGLKGIPADAPFYAIARFDRTGSGRVHIEDFAQVFSLRADQKYRRVNYEMIAMTLLQHAGGLDDLKEMTRRLVLNVLLGNGDAHIKNWSLIYRNPTRPQLAPAYDIVSTVAWTEHDQTVALNMAGVKRFDAISLDTFSAFFQRLQLPAADHDALMEIARTAAQRITQQWQQHYEAAGVPHALLQRVAEHLKHVPLRRI